MDMGRELLFIVYGSGVSIIWSYITAHRCRVSSSGSGFNGLRLKVEG